MEPGKLERLPPPIPHQYPTPSHLSVPPAPPFPTHTPTTNSRESTKYGVEWSRVRERWGEKCRNRERERE